MYTTLVSVDETASHLSDPDWALVDCRFRLADPSAGEQAYHESHVTGAVYAHLDRDLSGPVVAGRTGRHPLPDPARLAERFGAWGIGADTQVVAYDDLGGALAAARLWWLARWLGHDAVAVLDGGWQAWQAAGLPVRGGQESRPPTRFPTRLRPELVASTAEVQSLAGEPTSRLWDVRAADRFRGENETIDPVAGHIPGAVSVPFADNLAQDGQFLPPAALRARYEPLLAGRPAEDTAVYCGSGVTAAQTLLALAHAGLGEARLYAGSWSEWITDPDRPVVRGEEGEPGPPSPDPG